MATLLRSLTRQGRSLRLVSKAQSLRLAPVPIYNIKASISTSKKNKDVTSTVQPMDSSTELKRLTEHFENTDKDNEENWTSYGFEPGDRDTDWFIHHTLMFAIISIGVCWGGFVLAYMPDFKFYDWCQREAFLELERREREGLPLVDADYAKVDMMELPTDEEIGEQEIII